MKKRSFLKSAMILFLASITLSSNAAEKKNTKNAENAINAMTFNIRLANKGDKENYWEYRKDYAAEVIRFYDVDIVGMQEVLHQQLEDFKERLPEYDHIGVGRADGATKGEYSPILYKKDRFKLLDSGTFWLAEDINAVGKKGWDAACERVATWGLFKDKKTQKTFLYLNTHLDHVGEIARKSGAQLILDKTFELSGKYPAIVTGDFNATPDSEPINILTKGNNKKLICSRGIAELTYGPEWTFHNFGRVPSENRSFIDYIFLKGNFKVLKNGVLSENKGILYPSDHCPVISTLIIE